MYHAISFFFFFFSSRRRHTRLQGDWSSDVCSSDLEPAAVAETGAGSLVRRNGARRLPGAGGALSRDRCGRPSADARAAAPGVVFPKGLQERDVLLPATCLRFGDHLL